MQPRYSRKWSTGLKDAIDSGRQQSLSGALPDLTAGYVQEETYIYDICIKCGYVVKETEDG